MPKKKTKGLRVDRIPQTPEHFFALNGKRIKPREGLLILGGALGLNREEVAQKIGYAQRGCASKFYQESNEQELKGDVMLAIQDMINANEKKILKFLESPTIK